MVVQWVVVCVILCMEFDDVEFDFCLCVVFVVLFVLMVGVSEEFIVFGLQIEVFVFDEEEME